MTDKSKEISTIMRVLSQLVKVGVIEQVDGATARVKVTLDDRTTDWLPWIVLRADQDRDWNPPQEGAQAVVLFPDGDAGRGIVIGFLYQKSSLHPEKTLTKVARHFGDEAVISYDSGAHDFKLTLPKEATFQLSVGRTNMVISDAGVTVNAAAITVQEAG